MRVIDDMLRESNALPSLPAIVVELQMCLDEEKAGTKLLSEKISRDQSLAAKTLRLANSPLYSMQCAVATIKQAVAVLGFDCVRTMVTTAAIVNAFAARQLPAGFEFEKFWRHSLATGLCAKSLARAFKVDPDQAFITGLMHDIGQLVLARAMPDKFMEAMREAALQQIPLHKAEQAGFGFDHATIGARLAQKWNFPFAIQEAIAEHESPLTARQGPCLLHAVHVADALVNAYGLGGEEAEEIPDEPFSNPVWGDTEEADEILRRAASETKGRITEVYKSLVAH